MDKMSGDEMLEIFLSVVSKKTSNCVQIHRAKALKWTGERIISKGGLSMIDKEELWKTILVRALVVRDNRGNIISLSEAGYKELKNMGDNICE